MKDILISSSVLILALVLLRCIFRNTVSRRVQYALWGLVALRLLIPVSLPAMEFSVLSAAEPVRQTVSATLETPRIYVPVAREPLAQHPAAPDLAPEYAIAPGSPSVWVIETDETAVQYRQLSSADILRGIWLTGTALMALWLFASNLGFARRLRKARIPYPAEGCPLPVYLAESVLPSPCLFGLFRPAIYLTPAAVSSPETLRHVLAHEETHARHLDPLWSAVRCLCLVVYWFDPLVWLAAGLSRADGELACDEGAIARLGEAERIPYGRTLLSLIPIRRSRDPLLAATTMTAGKRQLKDRITRIAQSRQTVAAALFILLSAVLLVGAATFTGGKETPSPNEPGASSVEVVPLSGEELAWFNQVFFNNPERPLSNQFLSSLYSAPGEMDLFELFYTGAEVSAPISDEELAIVGSFDDQGVAICPTTKMPAQLLNAVFYSYTGLSLEETDRVGLENFQYLEEYDAYYHTHGDTNYRSQVLFTAGERAGDSVTLYYEDHFMGGGWKCVTLRETETGYHFRSNQPASVPAVPTVYPEGEPWRVIPLTGLSPYAPPEVSVERHADDCAKREGGFALDNGVSVTAYTSTDGNRYVAVRRGGRAVRGEMVDWEADCFLTLPDSAYNGPSMTFFTDLFGHDGLVVSYGGPISDTLFNMIHSFYTFDDAGTPSLLARVYGEYAVLDLDGDGTYELAASSGDTAQLFFAREGVVYEADLLALTETHWPELQWPGFSSWDFSGRCSTLTGQVPVPGKENDPMVPGLLAERTVYFDGEALRLYKPGTPLADLSAVPASVAEYAQSRLDALYSGQSGLNDQGWDDKRITRLELVESITDLQGLTAEVYAMDCAFHAAAPEKVMTAGGSYVDEDGWFRGFWVEEGPFFLRILNNGQEKLLPITDIPYTTDSVFFRAGVLHSLVRSGDLNPSTIVGEDLVYMFYDNAYLFLNDLGVWPADVRLSALERLAAAQTRTTELAEMFQHGMNNLFYNANGLDGIGAENYRILVDITNGMAVPSRVRTTAEAVVREKYEAARYQPGWEDADLVSYRVKSLERAYLYENFHGLDLTVYRMNYEFLARFPREAPLAGGMTVDPEGWICPTYPNSTWLFFHLREDGSQVYLYSTMVNDSVPGEELFLSDMEHYYFQNQSLFPAPAVKAEPAPHTAEEYSLAVNAAGAYLSEQAKHPNVVRYDSLFLSVDEAETARVVANYTGSELSAAQGISDETMRQMIAVLAVYDLKWAENVSAAPPQGDGLTAAYLYLLPDGGSWYVWDSTGAALPAEYQVVKEDLPYAPYALPELTTTAYDNFQAAYDSIDWTNGAFFLDQELTVGDITVVSWGYGGTPSGTAALLDVVYPDGTRVRLPLPPRTQRMAADSPRDLAIDADSRTLTYSVRFDGDLVDYEQGQLWHLAGTYAYTYDIAARTISLEIRPT